ncbi:DUF2523 domain-containing protein [Shewanella algae]|uniref:DUF2523 domain-containing protein n=1 Tax=Shewanella algae TaxID=38313 RepID=UPI000B8B35B8|nr:DUF2523 domain-containing protein [Shewanella algae]MBO2683539.1 DUF2523 domain-containing protein [Shewanella algae]OXR98959.1 hypothetical protein AMR44_20665 [Shewanella algae]QTE84344.1 DUF2523 domain-containing protein [Shewanella algae]QTE84353.1 DUF2523 domain-containing protein [Shewanella algae]HDS1213345.1 DUF2523 domain-containing protein [Shewanella algae]
MEYILILLNSIFPFLASFVGAMAARVALSIGFGTVGYSVSDYLFDSIINKLNESVSSMPSTIVSFLEIIGIPTAINIYLGAGSALLVLKGLSATGEIRKIVWSSPRVTS